MDLTGQKFGRLTVVRKTDEYYITPSTGKRTPIYECKCDCGNTAYVTQPQLRSGRTQSCGCLQRERSKQAHTKHGGRYERLHNVWAMMKNRCYNKNYSEYDKYGGRGIKVCDEWQSYPKFKEWALENGYDPDAPRSITTLDRIDVNRNYSPDNCRFVDMFVQANNKTNTILINYKGKEMTISELSGITGIEYDKLYYRIATCHLDPEIAIKRIRQ